MTITTKLPVAYLLDRATGQLATEPRGEVVAEVGALAAAPASDLPAVEAREASDLHVYMAFSSDPRAANGWNLALTLAPAETSPETGDTTVLTDVARRRTYTSSMAPPAAHVLAAAIQAALQAFVDTTEA
jgi:hypothetical protein